VVCSATNSCSIEGACQFDVTVIPSTVKVTVELSSTVHQGPFSRCITFDLWDCAAPGSPLHATVDANLDFTNGIVSEVTIDIPGGNWSCITARDRLHSLRSKAPYMTTVNGRDFTTGFIGPRPTGHWLLAGNLNDDAFIDILDFATFMPQFLRPAAPDTGCGTPSPNANINGDNVVDLIDFVFIQVNSLAAREPNCCGLPGVAAEEEGEPILSLDLAELRRRGLTHLRQADLNFDGVIDQADVSVFLESAGTGVRPTPPKTQNGPRTHREISSPLPR